MQITKDQWIAILTFAGAVLALAATQAFIPDTVKPYLTFAVGIINLALAIFFGVVRPIANALLAGRKEALEEAAKSAK